jgi:hypothetical protein
MTIVCDDDGKFQIIHYPPLPIEDSIAILQILEVEKQSFFLRFFFLFINCRNLHLQWKKFLIEQSLPVVNVDLKFVIYLHMNFFSIEKFFFFLGIKRNNSINYFSK